MERVKMNPLLIPPAEGPGRDFTDLARRIPFLRWLGRWHEKEPATRVKLDVQFIDRLSLPLEIKFRPAPGRSGSRGPSSGRTADSRRSADRRVRASLSPKVRADSAVRAPSVRFLNPPCSGRLRPIEGRNLIFRGRLGLWMNCTPSLTRGASCFSCHLSSQRKKGIRRTRSE